MGKAGKKYEKTGPGSDSMVRTYIVFVLLFVFGIAVIIKAAHIQIFEGAELRLQAEKMEYRYFDVDAVRGNIYASDGNLIATSIPIFDIRMDVASDLIPDRLFNDSVSWLALGLSRMFGDRTNWGYKKYLQDARKDGNRYLLIQNNVTYDQLSELKKLPIFTRGKYLGGLIAERSTRREYPYGMLARRTLGYVRTNIFDTLHVGLEGYFDQYLKGQPGRQLKQRMANKAWKPVFNNNNTDPQNGKDLIATIDTYLQDVTENSLMKHLYAHSAEKGTAILMEVQTGEIKAIANLQLNDKGEYEELYNLAVGEAFEPGSTFKLPSMMVAMEDGIIARTDSVEIGDGWTMFHGRTMKDSHVIDDDGWLTMEECFIYSSNVGVSRLIYDNYTGREWDFYNRLTSMLPLEKTGIEIHGERKPQIKSPDNRHWSMVTLPWMSIGYEIMVTPLQMLTFYNAVANDGVMVKPRLVKEIRNAGKTIKEFDTEVITKNICSESTLKLAKSYLEGVVEHGTATNIKNSVYKIAGKTGTAKINENGQYISKYNASFVGYFPADKPRYSCIVVIYRPNEGAYYATLVAAPVFKEIADIVYATELDIHPMEKNEYIKEVAENSITVPDKLREKTGYDANQLADHSESFAEFVKMETIPDVTGLGARDAVYLLENLGLVVKMKGKGLVKKQSLAPGTPLRRGNHIYLNLEI